MRIKISKEKDYELLINGINYDQLLNVKLKDDFTEEERCREKFNQYFKRYYSKVNDCAKFLVQHMHQDVEIIVNKEDEEWIMTIDGSIYKINKEAPFPQNFMHEHRAMDITLNRDQEKRE